MNRYKGHNWLVILAPAIVILGVFVFWELILRLNDTPIYIIPKPIQIAQRLLGDLPFFLFHGGVTLLEAMAGLFVGSLVAFCAAVLMTHSRWVEHSIYPLAVLIKVTPLVAVAPLFVIWFGFGLWPKVLIAALITFFPVLVNVFTGLRAVDPEVLNYFSILNASKREIFFKLRIPSSLPFVFAAARIVIPLSVIGAVVAEWFTGDRGLGSVIIVAHNNIDMPTLFSAVFVLAFIGVSLMLITFYLEKKFLFWHVLMIQKV